MDIYWIAEGRQRRGPLPVVEIISMLERGDLTPETKGWHQGCGEWVPLSVLPALSSYFEPVFAGDGSVPSDESVTEPESSIMVFVSPPLSIRLWARFFDALLYFVIYFAVVRLFADEFNQAFFLPWLWLPFMVMEACCLAWWGKTPGKFLLGLRVCDPEGRKLSLKRALLRAFYVLVFGTGMMTTIFTPVLVLFSWFYIRKNHLSFWDRRIPSLVDTGVVPGEVSPWMFFRRLLVLMFFVFVLLRVLARILEPWLPAIESVTRGAGL